MRKDTKKTIFKICGTVFFHCRYTYVTYLNVLLHVEHDTIPTRNFNNLILDQSILDNALPQEYLKGGAPDYYWRRTHWQPPAVADVEKIHYRLCGLARSEGIFVACFCGFCRGRQISKSASVSFYYCCLLLLFVASKRIAETFGSGVREKASTEDVLFVEETEGISSIEMLRWYCSSKCYCYQYCILYI